MNGPQPTLKANFPRLAGLTVLVVDDSPDIRELTRVYLDAEGARADFAENGEQALEKYRQEAYDLIIMDIRMPVLDGRSTARIMREEGFERPIVALTANPISDNEGLEYDGVFDIVLQKPILRHQLINFIATFNFRKGGVPAVVTHP